MSRGYWGFLFALVGIAILSFGMGCYHVASNYPDKDRQPQYRYARDQPSEVNPTLSSMPNSESLEYRRPCENPKGETESDLCAQWRAAKAGESGAFWAKWGVVAATIGSALLLWQIALTRKAVEDNDLATKAMLKSNEIAEKALAADRRAWMAIERIEFAGFSAPEQAQGGLLYRSNVEVIAKNHGGSLGRNCHFDSIIIIRSGGEDVKSKLEDFCDRWDADRGAFGDVIFPTQEITLGHGTGIFAADIEQATEGQQNRIFFPYLLVFVTYETDHIIGRRRTGFAYPITLVRDGAPFVLSAAQPDWWNGDIRITQPMYAEIT